MFCQYSGHHGGGLDLDFALYHFVQSDFPWQVQIYCYREGHKKEVVYRVTDVIHRRHNKGGCELQVGIEGIAIDVKWTESDEKP